MIYTDKFVNRRLSNNICLFSHLCVFVLLAMFGNTATAGTVNLSLDIFYADSNADQLVDANAKGTWQLYATADEEGLAGLATQLTGIAGLSATTNRPMFAAPTPAFKETYDSGTKTFDQDTDGDASTLELLFGQVPVASPGPQDLQYQVGVLGGSTPNVDELGVTIDTSGVSMTDAVLLAFGTFDAGGPPSVNLTQTESNVFTVVPASPGIDPPPVGSIVIATVNVQTRSNLTASSGDVNLDGVVNALDAGEMFGFWDGGLEERWLWQQGDLSGDKMINAIDAGALFGSWTGDAGPAATAAVAPEPTTLMLALLGLGASLTTQRRRNYVFLNQSALMCC